MISNYEVRFRPQAEKYLKKQDAHIQNRLKNALSTLSQQPFDSLEHYEGDHYKYRIGNYRALIDVEPEPPTVFIRVLEKREKIYSQKKFLR